jgi:hypothetical protein
MSNKKKLCAFPFIFLLLSSYIVVSSVFLPMPTKHVVFFLKTKASKFPMIPFFCFSPCCQHFAKLQFFARSKKKKQNKKNTFGSEQIKTAFALFFFYLVERVCVCQK